MNSEIFDWFVSSTKKPNVAQLPFIRIPANNIYLSYAEFFKEVDATAAQLEKNKIPQIEKLILDFSIDSLFKFFALLKLGKSLIILHPNRGNFNVDSFTKYTSNTQQIFILTSGSTGQPELWPHDIKSLTAVLPKYCEKIEITSENCTWSAFPPSSISGLKSLFIAAHAGGSLIWEPYPAGLDLFRFPEKIFSLKEISALAFSPNFAEALLLVNQREPFLFPKKMRLMCGGDVLQPQTMMNFRNNFHCGLNILYGLTETAGPITYLPADDWTPYGLGNMLVGDFKIAEMSKQLSVKGDFLSSRVTSEWLETSDCVELSSNAQLKFLSRLNDWVVWNGEKISLLEIENYLRVSSDIFDAMVLNSNNQLKALVHAKESFSPQNILEIWPNNFPLPQIEIVHRPFIDLGVKKKRTLIQ